jgi:hypothetical protein
MNGLEDVMFQKLDVSKADIRSIYKNGGSKGHLA